jgi:arylsulfatase A-like enzyme
MKEIRRPNQMVAGIIRTVYRRIFLLLFGTLAMSCRPEKQDKRPNIIMIVTDDHARNSISAYGSTINNTPHLDRLATEGVRFTNAFVTNALCGPSRAVILTGKYSHINGFRDNQNNFDGSQPTFPKMLQAAGYFTAVVGKWHLGTTPTGFDYWNIMIDQGHYYNPDFVEMGDTTRREGYATDLVTDIALQKLRDRPADKPFCLLLQQKAPHRNWMPNLKDLDLFAEDTIPLPATFYDDYATRSPAAREQDMRIDDMWLTSDLKLLMKEGEVEPGSGGNKKADGARDWQNIYSRFTPEQKEVWDNHYLKISEEFYRTNPKGKRLSEWKYQRYIKDYLASVHSVDENVGRVLEYLRQNDLSDNTIVIYTSDQGFFLGEHGWYDKRFMYEESMGTPMMLRYPQKVRPAVIDKLVSNLDLAPTLLDLAGIDVPSDMQGKSWVPLMSDTPTKEWRSSVYYHYYEFPHGWHDVKRHYGIRTDRYKLIHFYNDIDAWELYDLVNDPNELNNLYSNNEFAPLVDSLKTELGELQRLYRDSVAMNIDQMSPTQRE